MQNLAIEFLQPNQSGFDIIVLDARTIDAVKGKGVADLIDQNEADLFFFLFFVLRHGFDDAGSIVKGRQS
jgi:hypothetical protein